WLWGPFGLLLSTPLTACLVVMGRYVPLLEFFSVLLGDEPVLEPPIAYYQRLLARDQEEATELVESYLETHPLEEVYDQVFLPALRLAKQNRERGILSSADEEFILQVTRELLDEVVPLPAPAEASHEASESSAERVLVFGCPARDEVDELALRMLEQLLDAKKCQFDIISTTT